MQTIKHIGPGLRATFKPARLVGDFITLSGKDFILLGMMLIATIAAFIFGQDFSVLGVVSFVVGIATVANLILIDRGRLTNYAWGMISTLTWLIIAWHNHLIGDITTQIFFFIMQFVGIAVWHKSITDNHDEHGEIIAKKLSRRQMVVLAVILLIAYFVQVYLSRQLHGTQIWLDSAVLPLNIAAEILMIYGFASQWFMWTLINLINIVIWINQLHAGGVGSTSMLILQIVMTINGMWGWYLWNKSANTQQTTSDFEKELV
ncbi:ribosyl nicotinamide transporter [Periweissella cryptocerci]|uniref:Ribosyl nicotinamide transporter n=1 Tax=Periweissella cryptocerci TaxID=2506420 RepID=A0A4P6YW82_9LACO|nr:nicotinamide riboside transporter PnuC [Periweissella cryptocerci]QBO37094.1 ribosyl nicotinamide transporter [Periweissella cryptocerci]